MARTANVFARVEPEVKEQAECIQQMKLKQKWNAYGSLTKEQFNAEIEKGMEDIKAGRVYSADEVEAEMKREFGIWNIKWCIQQEQRKICEIFSDIFQSNC